MRPPLTLVKLGGSLITDKSRPLTPRVETLARLAAELVEADLTGTLIVGHGSGSFGHVAAAEHSIHRGVSSPEQIEGVTATQMHAHRLHTLVMGSLWQAGGRPFSIAPSSNLVATAGEPGEFNIGPVVGALELGLLPVTFGDVVVDGAWGASICSTEQAFEALVAALDADGTAVERVLWLGATEGLLDERGETIARVGSGNREASLAIAGDSAAEDVTGGMQLRLQTALRLADRGIRSWIGNGLVPGRLPEALAGREVPGTCVVTD